MRCLLHFILILYLICQNCDAFSKKHLLRIAKIRAFDIIDKAKIGTDECSTNLKSLITDLMNFKHSWALKMIDASAKPQTGILTGNIHQIGNYDECLAIKELRGKYGTIEGQYCTVTLMPSLNYTTEYSYLFNMLNFSEWITGLSMEDQHIVGILKYQKSTFGICLPKACSTENLQKIWDHVEKTFKLPAHIDFSENMCSYKGKLIWPFPIDNYIFMFFGSIAALLILSTMYDLLVYQYLEDKSDNIWISFSMYTNTKKILKISEVRETFLDCTAGLKTISMFAVIYGHKFSFMIIMGNINNTDLFKWRTQFQNAFSLSIHYSVDTFLVLSGMFLSYTYIKTQETALRGKSFPLFKFYFYRFLRFIADLSVYDKKDKKLLKHLKMCKAIFVPHLLLLWPGLLATILFYIGILKYMTDGPFWPGAVYKSAPICKATGWATALFMTNLISFPYQCVEQSWYLAVDTQLYLISPIVLIYLYKHPRVTTVICTFMCTLSAIYAFVITYKYHYGHNVFESDKDYHDYIYQPTYMRMSAWFIGVFLGYILYYYRQILIPKGLQIFVWIVTFCTLLSLIFIHTIIARRGYNNVTAAWYNACARPLWAMTISTLIFLCASGHGGNINKFLSHKLFLVIPRISYSVYLTHIAFQASLSCSKRTFTHYTNFNCIHQFFADLPFILGIALLWSLAFEAPFINIASLLVKKDYKKEITDVRNNEPTNPKRRKNRTKNKVLAIIMKDAKKID